MSFQGADTEQLREQAASTRRGGQRIEDLLTTLDGAVHGAAWTGPDAEEFRRAWSADAVSAARHACDLLDQKALQLDQDADEQDRCSEDGAGSGGDRGGPGGQDGGPTSPWDALQDWLDEYEAKESDGFFGDLLGGPESGYWGNLGWSGVSIAGDIAGLVPEPTGVAAGLGLAVDVASIGIGLYDAAQSFQDGDPFGTVDGLVTAGINYLDVPAGILSMVPVPQVKVVGEALGAVTGGLDLGWSSLTALAQASAIAGGPGEGSASRFIVEAPGWAIEQVTGNSIVSDTTDAVTGFAEDGFGWGSSTIRDAVPIIDLVIDSSQILVENVIPSGVQEGLEGFAGEANDWIRDKMPW